MACLKLFLWYNRKMITWRFLNPVQALDILSNKDEYIRRLNAFNLELHEVKSVEEYFENLPQHVFDWSEEQIQNCQGSLASVSQNLQDAGVELDEEICLILTNGKEMFNLEYTRGNAIIFPYASVSKFTDSKSDLFGFTETLIVHELFHVLSRKYPKIRTPLFKTFGFVELERDYLAMAYDEQIINPDALDHKWSIEVFDKKRSINIKGFPLIRKGDWKTFIEITDSGRLGEPMSIKDTNLFEKINKKLTQYVSHPEEVAAEYFKIWICYPEKRNFKEIAKFSEEFLKQLKVKQ